MDPKDRESSQRREPTERPEADVGDAASARQEEIGPSGGPPSDADRQRRGATPTEDVMDRALAGQGGERTPELGEPDSGVPDTTSDPD